MPNKTKIYWEYEAQYEYSIEEAPQKYELYSTMRQINLKCKKTNIKENETTSSFYCLPFSVVVTWNWSYCFSSFLLFFFGAYCSDVFGVEKFLNRSKINFTLLGYWSSSLKLALDNEKSLFFVLDFDFESIFQINSKSSIRKQSGECQ